MLSKKKLTELFLRREDREKIEEAARQLEEAIPFDENYFQFRMESHATQLGLIKVEATITKGERTGDKLNMKCKWFNRTQKDMREVPEVTGCYYQPSIDDVGSTITVQAEPFMQGKEYQGITIMREVGPLRLDDRVEQQYQKAVREQKLQVPAKLQTIFSQSQKFAKVETPQDVLVLVTPAQLKLYMKSSNNKYDLLAGYPIKSGHPALDIIRKTPSSFLLNVSEDESFRLSVEDNLNRDVVALVVRSFCSRKLMVKEQNVTPTTHRRAQTQEETVATTKTETTKDSLIEASSIISVPSEPSLQFVMKLDELSRALTHSTRELERLQDQYDSQRRSHNKLMEENDCLQQKVKVLEVLADEHHRYKHQVDKLHEQNTFYMNVSYSKKQEIGIYKNAIRFKDGMIEELQDRVRQLEAAQQQHRMEEQQHIQQPLQRIRELELELTDLSGRLEQTLTLTEQQQQQLDRSQDQNRRLLKKCEGLADQSALRQTDLLHQRYRHESAEKDHEIAGLKTHIFKLQTLYSKLQAERNQDQKVWNLKQIVTGLKSSKNQQAVYLQKLVNSLTETVSEKEIELQSQKIINRQLTRRLQQHQQQN